ncbi:hypothetical protein Pa193_043 [Pseudomonas virus Pa193]|uniref:Phage protein n=1 Tax=Pseudomonas virus Pa193 TaxID=2590837 RepID=A0A5P1KV49_9CAUD|nr:hypothetical protein H6S64_gp43 [Pseudomonas virus Pa193]QDH45953.1 hypothetical protein Pa193_043 [Pseudomonas virus Pa193]
MTVYIVSAMTQSVSYNAYDTSDPSNPRLQRKILIRGRAGIASETSGFGDMISDAAGRPIWTPQGDCTAVSDSDFELLQANKIFMRHMDKGYLRVVKTDITSDHQRISKETRTMERDGFQPLDADRLQQKIKVTTASASQEQEFRI